MTSVPKPLKFLRPHYHDLQKLFETWPTSEDKVGYLSVRRIAHQLTLFNLQSLFADILSVLAMTYSDTEVRGTLRYRLLSAALRSSTSKGAKTPDSDPGSWGHEYIRHLASELGEEYTARTEDTQTEGEQLGTETELHALASQCATFFLGHNAEPDAVDLLEEMEIVESIVDLVDENTYARTCTYMIRFVILAVWVRLLD
jgi:26S proteasome regulatory subunit N1